MTVKPNFDVGEIGVKIAEAKQKFVGDVLKKRARLTPDRMALEWKGKLWTYKELNTEVNKLSNNFLKIGVERGQRICVVTNNRGECAHLLYVAAKIGAIIAFVNWRYTEKEMEEAINVLTPETLIVESEFYQKVKSILGNLPYVKRVICLDEMEEFSQNVATYTFQELVTDGSDAEPIVEKHEEDALYIVYTSGTTGTPKGAIISQRAEIQRIIAFMATYPALLGTTGDDSCIVRGPYFHVTSIHETFATHAMGGKVIVLAGYNVTEMVDILEREQVSWLSLSPGMYEKFVDEVKRRNAKLKGIRAIGSIADITPHEQIAELTMVSGAPFFNTYGLTEIGIENFCTNVLPIGKPGTVYNNMGKDEGFACEVRLLNSEGEEVPDGEPGELVIRTPMMFSGYWNNPKVNVEVFRDGWFHTGDVLKRNPDGKLDFVSRTKYLIKSGAENIYPAEIERALLKHPHVREACVVSARHPKWGETPVAFVAVSGDVTPEELKEFCRNNLARYKVPNVIEIVDNDDFPRNLTGKVLREKVELWVERIQSKIV
jgi:acyl-CoA synthetase (AMP-forming)/AMP-acid ligase II